MEKNSAELKRIMAKNLEFQLKRNKKTQREMCLALNFKENTVSDWLNGKTYPRIDKIEMMANYFSCKKSDLIERPSFVSEINLTNQEYELLNDFRVLNAIGKEKACTLIHDFTDIARYVEPIHEEKNASSQ